jgi:hypothetical protein
MLRRLTSTDPTRATFELRGTVMFLDSSGVGLQLTSMHVDFVDGGGGVERNTAPIDVTLAPGGSATQTLPERITLRAGEQPARVRISANGIDRDGRARTTDVADSELAFGDAGGPVVGGPDATILAAGDIADCANVGAQSTARLLDTHPGEVLTLGDHAYPSATRQALATCYESTWGRHKGRTRATPGNHDWGEDSGTPYYEYFGAAAGPRTGYYSFNVGSWHVLSLNSNIGGGVSSPQFHWVLADLAANPSRCTMAVWHHPRFSSGANGSHRDMQQLWWLLDNNGVDVVLAGHEHGYERFAPQDHEGVSSPTGIRQFVVGTGGGALTGYLAPLANSQVRGSAWGVLRMTLRSDSYAWTFLPAAGAAFTDSGSDTCR